MEIEDDVFLGADLKTEDDVFLGTDLKTDSSKNEDNFDGKLKRKSVDDDTVGQSKKKNA